MELVAGDPIFPKEYGKIISLMVSYCPITEVSTSISRGGELLDLTYLLIIGSQYLSKKLTGPRRCYKIFKSLNQIYPGKIDIEFLKLRADPKFVEHVVTWEDKYKVVDGKVTHKVVIGETMVVTFTMASREITFVSLRNKISQLLQALEITSPIKKISVKSSTVEKLLDDYVIDMRRRRTILVSI